MPKLTSKAWLDEHLYELPDWQQEAFRQFANMIDDPAGSFPCIPGRHGFLNNNLRFGFASDPREENAINIVSELLQQYGDISRETGKYASLVIFFETPAECLDTYTMDQYEVLFWSVLSRISAKDDAPWPEGISTDPAHHSWEFCFNGQPYFAFCSTPAHTVRRSRQSPYFTIAFQPRFVFEKINDSTAFGRNMRKLIREKLVEYDGIPAHPSLKWYGQEDNQEWKQYFLRDDESAPSKCPYTYMKKKVKGLGRLFHK